MESSLEKLLVPYAPAENIAELKIFGDKPGIKITLEVSVVYQAKIITWI